MTLGNCIDTEIKITWILQRDELQSIYDDWRALMVRTGADLYLGPDWFDAWWDQFGTQRSLACLTAYHGELLIGIVPFSIETIRVGPMRYRLARLAGTDPHSIVLNLPIEPTWSSLVLSKGLSGLLSGRKCDLISFSPASDVSHLLPLVRNACLHKAHLRLRESEAGSHTVFDLPENFDLFLNKLSKKRRAQFRRDVRSLIRSQNMSCTVVSPDASGFRNFVHFHNRQWQAVGQGGHFCDWPKSEAFYSAFAERTTEHGSVQLHILRGKAGFLAMQFALVSGTTCHWRLPARSLEAEAERFGVGKVGLLMMIKQLIAQGVTQVEGGVGEYDYKRTWGGKDVCIRKLIVTSSLTPIKLSLLLVWADFLDLVYYRIWFKKLAPRLRRVIGGEPRPLWRTWIRTRL